MRCSNSTCKLNPTLTSKALQRWHKIPVATWCSLRYHLAILPVKFPLIPLSSSLTVLLYSEARAQSYLVSTLISTAPSSWVPILGTNWVFLVNGLTNWQHPSALGSFHSPKLPLPKPVILHPPGLYHPKDPSKDTNNSKALPSFSSPNH